MIAQCCLLYSGTVTNAVARNECSMKPKLDPVLKPMIIVLRSSPTTPTVKTLDRRIQRPWRRLQRPQKPYQ